MGLNWPANVATPRRLSRSAYWPTESASSYQKSRTAGHGRLIRKNSRGERMLPLIIEYFGKTPKYFSDKIIEYDIRLGYRIRGADRPTTSGLTKNIFMYDVVFRCLKVVNMENIFPKDSFKASPDTRHHLKTMSGQ
eukprot:gene17652-biopygen5078